MTFPWPTATSSSGAVARRSSGPTAATWPGRSGTRRGSSTPSSIRNSCTGRGSGSTRPVTTAGRICSSSRSVSRRAAKPALVADASRHAVGVEALEQKLRSPARGADQVAETAERDALGVLELRHEEDLRAFVGSGRDRVAVADTHQPAAFLQESRKGAVVDLDRLEA